MKHVETIVPHSKDEIKLQMKRENGKPVFNLQLPKGLGGQFIFEGKTIHMKEETTKTIKL